MGDFFNTIIENVTKIASSVRWNDILDIVLVTFALYYFIKLFRQTRAIHLLKGIGLLAVFYLAVSALDLSTSSFLFSRLFGDIVIVTVILFHPEIRHALESFGRGDFTKFNFFSSHSAAASAEQLRASASYVAKAAANMSEKKIGALIVFEGRSPLGEIVSTGSRVNAAISTALLENIFFPKAPLHDGAVVIRNNEIEAAGCILPLTQNNISRELGTRHRAALGMSEHTDALVVVVSEETGAISVAKNSVLTRDLTSAELYETISAFLITDDLDGKNSSKGKRRKTRNEK